MDLKDMDEEVKKTTATRRRKESKKQVEEEEEEEGGGSIEKLFENSNEVVPPWGKQITLRSIVASLVLSVLFTIIVMKLNLTTGVIPSLNVSAGLLGYFFVKSYTKVLQKLGWLKQPFTRQENTVIQTCVVASSGIAFSGGFGSYLFGMSKIIAQQSGDVITSENVKDPELRWMIGFLFCVSFLGLFSVIAIRKIMIIKFKLSYPSGTATANLINSFHTPQGAKVADKQVKALGFSSFFSFVWGVFLWLVSRKDGCGLGKLPIFGFKARDSRFYFDCSAMYIGVGMICPYIINISMLLGAILSWGIMWPQIDKKKGNWFPADLDSQNLHGLQGYKVFIAIAIILGDGLYNFVKILYKTYDALKKTYKSKELPVVKQDGLPALSYDDERRTQVFLKDQIPMWIPFGGYCGLCVVCIPLVSLLIFPQLKWYYMLCILFTAPILGFCNAYGCGLTDWSLASTYGKLTIFIIGAWAGAAHGGVIAGLAACGVMMNVVSTASDLMQDFKTGYMTLSSPISMLTSQVIGTAMGCAISPCVFYFFLKANKDLGVAGSAYPAPYALIYRNMADLGLEGFSSLPKHCLIFCCAFFAGAILVNIIRDLVGEKWSKWIPVPMAMAIPFYTGGYFTIDMCLGSLILFIWQKRNKAKADTYSSAVASGLICGDGIWSLPTALLSLFGVQAPFCIRVP